MKYQANPIIVEARAIVAVYGPDSLGDLYLTLEDGGLFTPDAGMVSRMKPQVGDYVVAQADGYIYLNPKAVFEHKYAPIPDAAEKVA